MNKVRLLVILLATVFIAAACQTSSEEGVRVAPEVGAIAPEFTLLNTSGDEVSLSDHRGQVVMLNFWATWCPPCRQEMPGIESRYQQHRGNLEVLAIDNDEALEQVLSFTEEFGLSFDPLLDPGSRVQIQYQVRAYPTTVFVNEHGIIQFVHIGLMTESQLDGYLEQMGLN